MTTRPVALITGASGGIGADLARIMARSGHALVLVARSEPDLSALADEIALTSARPVVIALDLTRTDAASILRKKMQDLELCVDILVNNAGFGLLGAADRLDHGEQISMLDLNIRALTDLTLTFLPDVLSRKGRILNVASVAAFVPGPGMAVYYASKAFVLSFSQALGYELRDKGVTVTTLCPGPVATGFQARAGFHLRLPDIYQPMSSYDVAAAAYRAMMRGQAVAVVGFMNQCLVFLAGHLPKSVSLRLVGRMQAGRLEP